MFNILAQITPIYIVLINEGKGMYLLFCHGFICFNEGIKQGVVIRKYLRAKYVDNF